MEQELINKFEWTFKLLEDLKKQVHENNLQICRNQNEIRQLRKSIELRGEP